MNYSDLDTAKQQIRLLRLNPGVGSEDTICDLTVASLDDLGPFEALPYVWGDSSETLAITLSGAPTQITTNLHAAFRHLRYTDRPRLLWVDALCINQSNVLERNQQVRLMRDIYSGAVRVIAWLGSADPDTDTSAVELIKLMASDDTIHWTDARVADSILTLNYDILNNPWWRRVWTVQEAVVAKELVYVYGDSEITDAMMMDMSWSFMKHTSGKRCCPTEKVGLVMGRLQIGIMLSSAMDSIMKLKTLREAGQGSGRSFLLISTIFGPREVTDLRDKVFGFLGVSSDITGANSAELIDYTLDVTQVYEKATRKLIEQSQTLDVFSCLRIIREEYRMERLQQGPPSLPSWVPDWSVRSPTSTLGFRILSYKMRVLSGWKADGGLKAEIQNTDRIGSLALHGHVYDEVQQVAEEKVDIFEDVGVFLEWRAMAEIDRNPDKPYVSGGTSLDAYWKTLCLNINPQAARSYRNEPASAQDRNIHDQWWFEQLLGKYNIHHELLDMKMQSTSMDSHIRESTMERKFFITKRGYYGLGYEGITIGDQVAIMAGGKMPLILRETKDDAMKNVYHLVGDAYIHGLMQGEAMKTEDGEIRELQKLVLV